MSQEARFSRLEPDLRKAELIEATLTCLKLHGFQGASIRKISAEAGVSVGLISHHYSGKDELVAEAYRAITGRVMTLLREAMEQAAPDPRQRLSAFFRASFCAELLDPRLLDAWLAFWGAVKTAEAINLAHEHSYGEYRNELAGLLGQLAGFRAGKASTPIWRPSASAPCSTACGWNPGSTRGPSARSRACRSARPGSRGCWPAAGEVSLCRHRAVDRLFSNG